MAGKERRKTPLLRVAFGQKIRLGIVALCYICCGTCTTILFKSELNTMQNYPFVTSIFNLFCALFLFGVVAFVRRCILKRPKGTAPLRIFLPLSISGAFTNFFQIVGGSLIGPSGGQAMVILGQAILPLTILFSYLFLKKRYSMYECLGSYLVLFGMGVVLVPNFYSWITGGLPIPGGGTLVVASVAAWTLEILRSPRPPLSSSVARLEEGSPVTWYGALVFFVADLPNTINNVFKEWIFRQYKANVFSMGFWERCFEFPMLLLIYPAYTYFGPQRSLDLQGNLVDGLQCLFLGTNTFPDDRCQNAWWIALLFNFLSMIRMALGIALIRYSSANLCFFSNAITVPLSQVLFSMPWLMGKDATGLTIFTVAGLVPLISGVLICGSFENSPQITATPDGQPASAPPPIQEPLLDDNPPPGVDDRPEDLYDDSVQARDALLAWHDYINEYFLYSRERDPDYQIMAGMRVPQEGEGIQ
ncbi:putative Transmembrane transporter protein [Paratrimastix pyriformis]|uniref:Transmembrane transporter protein n=1 Tax=Paratrimastix pyriformis TaxID=342808 RepID=A0ABQ8UWS3_9EUKA|nr:putative Transmembrane transporter protein [Paratrimastix pyriformis]